MTEAVRHEHKGVCPPTCPRYSDGYERHPEVWPNDPAAIISKINEIRHHIIVARGELDELTKMFGDEYPAEDYKRSIAHSEGCLTGALVMLWEDIETWDKVMGYREGVERRLAKQNESL
jgi:hypothetical protein